MYEPASACSAALTSHSTGAAAGGGALPPPLAVRSTIEGRSGASAASMDSADGVASLAAHAWLRKARALSEEGDWAESVAALHVCARLLEQRDDPPVEVLEAWEDWRTRVMAFLGEEEPDDGPTVEIQVAGDPGELEGQVEQDDPSTRDSGD